MSTSKYSNCVYSTVMSLVQMIINLAKSILPISKDEFKKFIPLFVKFFLISLTYGILRRTKDTLVLSAAKGSHIIPFLKFCYVLPMALIFVSYYSYLSNRFDKDKVFLYALMPFMIFFLTYAFLIHPNQEALTLNSILNAKSIYIGVWKIGVNINIPIGFAQSIQYWYLSLFYTFSELFGSVVLSLLFWQCANTVCSYDLAKRAYPALALGANLALVVQFRIAKLLQSNVQSYLILAFFASISIYLLQKYVMKQFGGEVSKENAPKKKKKAKLSVFESFHLLFNSKHLLMIAAIVLFYNISINLIEMVWKNTVSGHFINKTDMDLYFATVNSYLGYTSIFLALFVSGQAERSMGWTFAALITPVASLAFGCLFFIFVLCKDSLSVYFLSNPIMIALVLGATQNVIAKAAKYTLFDPTKEKAYMPLNSDERSKGKAAIDVVGARLGKSGGAVISMILMQTVSDSISTLTPIFFILFTIAVAFWIVAAINLGGKLAVYESSIQENTKQKTNHIDNSKEQISSPNTQEAVTS